MKCPNCGDRTSVDSGGFSADESPVKECGVCGLVWRIKVEHGESRLDIIRPAEKKGC